MSHYIHGVPKIDAAPHRHTPGYIKGNETPPTKLCKELYIKLQTSYIRGGRSINRPQRVFDRLAMSGEEILIQVDKELNAPLGLEVHV